MFGFCAVFSLCPFQLVEASLSLRYQSEFGNASLMPKASSSQSICHSACVIIFLFRYFLLSLWAPPCLLLTFLTDARVSLEGSGIALHLLNSGRVVRILISLFDPLCWVMFSRREME